MIVTPNIPLPPGWTNAPYVEDIQFPGRDLTGATFAMQLRQYPGADGDPEATFYIDASVAILPDKLPLTVLTVSIGEVEMGKLPVTGEPGAATLFYFDLICTPAGGYKSVLLSGSLLVRQGVTRP